jgi:hypothetical protein
MTELRREKRDMGATNEERIESIIRAINGHPSSRFKARRLHPDTDEFEITREDGERVATFSVILNVTTDDGIPVTEWTYTIICEGERADMEDFSRFLTHLRPRRDPE